MSYISRISQEAFKDSTLEMVEAGKLVRVYKLTPPKRFHWCYLMFTPLGVVIGGDQRFGDRENGAAHSVPGMEESGFLGDHDEEYLGSKFFGRKPSGRVALDRWANDVGWLCALQQEFRRLVELAGRS